MSYYYLMERIDQMLNQSIKDTFLELRDKLFNSKEFDVEEYLNTLADKSHVSYEDLVALYNSISLWKMEEAKKPLTFAKRKLWSKGENQTLLLYVDWIKLYEDKSNKALFDDLSEILYGRTPSSVSYQYYHNLRPMQELENPKEIEEPELPEESAIEVDSLEEPSQSEDLLDMVVELVDNVDSVGIDLNPFFKGMLTLSQKAVENNKSKIDELEGEVSFYKNELENEKEKNDQLQRDVAKLINDFEKLKSEVEYFDGLSGKQKLQQLHNYNSKIKYMVDKFGGVIAVAIDKDNAI